MNASAMLLEAPKSLSGVDGVHRPVLLCVELSPHVMWVSRSLRRQGADTRRAITVEHAEQLIHHSQFDGVILNAAIEDCQHLIGVLRNTHPDTAVFALPGRDSDARRLCEMDCAIVLPQPINERELWASVCPFV